MISADNPLMQFKLHVARYAHENGLFKEKHWRKTRDYWFRSVQEMFCSETRSNEISNLRKLLFQKFEVRPCFVHILYLETAFLLLISAPSSHTRLAGMIQNVDEVTGILLFGEGLINKL